MISWNSQMALDARQHLFFHETSPTQAWKVRDPDGKEFIIKLYELTNGTNAIDDGHYIESKRITAETDSDYDLEGPEAGTEWCFLEMSIDRFMERYETSRELSLQ